MDDDIVVYKHPNSLMRSFFVPDPISPPLLEIFRRPISKSSRERMKSLGSIGGWVVKELLEISGIVEIRTRPREILIKKERGTSWEGIEPEVLKILRRALRKQQIHLVKR